MGRNRVVIDADHYIVFGFDPPCDGYFAQYYDRQSEQYKEEDAPSDEIGFAFGVSKNRILDFLEKHNAVELAKIQTKEAFHNLCLDLPC
jgi:hypothetical protein